LTYAQGEEKIKASVDGMLNENKIEYTVQETAYSYGLPDAGLSVDYETPLREAMLYGREGTRWDLLFEKTEPKDWPLDYAFDETKLDALIDMDSATWGEAAVDAAYAVDKQSNKENLTTGGTLTVQEPKDGWKVDVDGIKETAKNQIDAKLFAPFAAQIDVVKAQGSDNPKEMVKMGSYTTNIGSSSSKGRKFNIWMISDKLNGAVFKPGETFSVNDYVGDRTEELGWALAPGIENGTYTDQAGGGICQVSSTFYNAALRAEMDMVARLPHTIMAGYVPPGMDATISTGGPDFKVKNINDTDMIMIVTCNIPDMKVTVDIYGTVERDYYLKFESELINKQDAPAVKYKTNAALGKYEVKRTKVGQGEEKYQIWGQKYHKDTDAKIGEKFEVTTSTYRGIAPEVELGSGVPLPAEGTAIEDVQAQAKELEQKEAEANNPQPTPSPEATPAPTVAPEPTPPVVPEQPAA
ncbi:MAG: VanW family protein, partial [Christensenella sp.]|uniref:VanW family protein n=1 Tax=Christensenella sp. TaxID=1935934 RepID=UPI002B1FDD6F